MMFFLLLLAHFVLFPHVDEFAVLVVELILQEGHLLVGNDANAKSVLDLPFALQGNYTLIDECRHIGMDVQRELFNAYLVDKTVNFAL